MRKKELIHKGMMSKSRLYIGFKGLTPHTIHRFCTAFDGTVIRPHPSDVIKVKVQATFKGDLDSVIQTLCASNNSEFLTKRGEFLIFYKARRNENEAGSD